ncbi:MAG: signal peptidase I [Candidatus Krumholzibacteria bacterium]|nr:signal peptidase I [Candidatus Krumholzibacteria bacterium]MDP6669917.1 signal peptidase I [Candidatus Krumholzibacteria bacterium]MDP6796983.1 signal peptidase I [Candidatus Krumholzibacteria bacterium]MDP7022542.1 signal peptidase I [Candidatus Krumholzibacteria bacterium]
MLWKKKQKKKKHWAREILDVIVWALVMVFLARSFVVQAFHIPSGSMEDTLLVGDFLFVNKFLYGSKIPLTDIRLPGLREPRPGDIVVFRPSGEKQDYIKRCVAVEGQTLELKSGILYRDGERVEENYVKFAYGARPQRESMRDFGPVTVPEGEIFLLGDNRDNSKDSRYVGTKNWRDTVQGKAVFIYFSWNLKRNFPRLDRIGDLIH